MIIVLEGADGVGKTTLADAIEAAHPGPCVRFSHGPPPDGVLAAPYYMDCAEEMIEATSDGLVVCDRFHVGELVYGPLLRGEAGLTVHEASVVDMVLDGAGAALAHCVLGRDETVERLYARDGGVADARSGASVGHSFAIRAAFLHKCGRRSSGGLLPGYWRSYAMDAYPEQLASRVLLEAEFRWRYGMRRRGWVGKPSPPGFVLAMPSDDCRDIHHMAWVAENLRRTGLLYEAAMVFPSTDLSGLDMSQAAVVAMGTADEWLDERAVPFGARVAHGSDRHEWDDGGDWRFAVRAAVAIVSELSGLAHQ